MSEDVLARLLGYPTLAAFRQSFKRNLVPVPVFTPEGRRGKFALVRDIAVWMHRSSKEAAARKI